MNRFRVKSQWSGKRARLDADAAGAKVKASALNHARMHVEKLFAYGTLKDNDIRKALFGGRPVGAADVLPGFAKTTTTIAGIAYPNIVPAEDSSVEGEVMEVDKETLRSVDAYESDLYSRKKMTLASGCVAWVYIRE